MRQYGIYVPAVGTVHDVRPGSAIVGDVEDGIVTAHIEGGGASNVQTFEEKLQHAAGRRAARYPTSAVRSWPRDAVVRVGATAYDAAMRHWVVTAIDDEPMLRRWLGGATPPAIGGSEQLRLKTAGRLFTRLPQMEQATLMAARMPPAAFAAEVLRRVAALPEPPEGR